MSTTALHSGKRIQIWFQDEARIGQKGRVTSRWWVRGERPVGLCDRRFTSAYLYGAICPATGENFALVFPKVSTPAMTLFLDGLSRSVAPDVHILLVLDQAGWHKARTLTVPDNITLLSLPPYSPELNPIERVWLYLKERFLSHRLFDGYEAIVQAVCNAWNAMTATPDRIRSLTNYPWISKVNA